MLSLIVYGRNDQHGYNSHRRVALSLNAMAEVLTAASDEILFVDYNTPAGMPTLPEAISDTLTDRALDVIRVLRVTAAMHEAAAGDRSKHPINEPLARNTAIRRARPGNWILSTNTDMVFVPRGGTSLSEVVSRLDGDAYCLPRFEIPEWLWESVPRTDPQAMIDLLAAWGERAGLDEVTLGHEWILYDAPGDFQLLRRSLIEEIHGFDEEMMHGWHVDSNLWKRVHNRLGHIGTLYPDVAGYHANHNRTITRWVKSESTGNDLTQFVFGVQHSALPAQADTWGLAGEDVPEIALARPDLRSRLALSSVRIPGQERPLITSDTREQRAALDYDIRHVLPFLLDPIICAVPRPAVAYVGINESARQTIAAALDLLSPPAPLLPAPSAASADIVVIDLGVDVSTGRGPMTRDEAVRLVAEVDSTLRVLSPLATRPNVTLINGMSGMWVEWVAETFQVLYGTFHTRVQSAVLHEAPDELPRAADLVRTLVFETREPSIGTGSEAAAGITNIDLSRDESIDGLLGGWAGVDRDGAFVGASKACLRFADAVEQPPGRHAVVDMTTWRPSGSTTPDSIHVHVTIDGESLLDEEIAPKNRQTAFHTVTQTPGGTNHDLMLTVKTGSGADYMPEAHGGVQPWVRLERLRLIPAHSEPSPSTQGGALIPLGLNTAGETLLRGWWARSDPDGVWAIAGGGAIAVPPTLAASYLKLNVLGHPGRSGQETLIVARGDGERTTLVQDAVCDQPKIVVSDLPPAGPDGLIYVSFEAIDEAAPTGELLHIRGLGPGLRTYPVGATLALAAGSDDLTALRNGWYAAEPLGVWTADQEATLAFQIEDDLPAGGVLVIVGGCLDPTRQELAIDINGTMAPITHRRGGRITVPIRHQMAAGQVLVVTMRTPQLLVPSDEGLSEDPRPLGAYVRTLSLQPSRQRPRWRPRP